MTLATIDIVLLVLIAISVLFGVMRGAFSSMLSLLGWILSFYLTFITYPLLAPYLEKKISSSVLALFIGNMLLLIAYLIAIGVINVCVNVLCRPFRCGFFDRALGLIFGMLRGVLLIQLAIVIYVYIISSVRGVDVASQPVEQSTPLWMHKSAAYEVMDKGATTIIKFMPDIVNEWMMNFYNQVSDLSNDDRFESYIALKLLYALPEELQRQYQQDLSKKSLKLEDDALDRYAMERLYRVYSKALDDDQIEENKQLADYEMERVKKLFVD